MMANAMTCPNCRGLGRMEGDDYSMECWVCHETGLVHPKRWAAVQERLKLGLRSVVEVPLWQTDTYKGKEKEKA